MKHADACELEHQDAPWAIPLPTSDVLMAPDLWKAILDPETKSKGRMIAVLSEALSKCGMLGNRCPPEVREKIRKMAG